MGGSEIRVAEGARVDVSKFALMGGHDIRLDCTASDPGGPVIRLRLLSIMGKATARQGMSQRRRRELSR